MDRSAVVWTRLAVTPMKMGSLFVTDTEARFSYTQAYLDTGLPGLGLVYRPDAFGLSPIVMPRTPRFALHPPLQSLVPPAADDNFMRALILRYFDKLHIRPRPGFDTDWEILTRAGHGGIGHLDVFASDEAAQNWYATASRVELVKADDGFGFSLKEFLGWIDTDRDIDALITFVGPTPTLGGAIPKLALSIPRSGWDGRIGLPTRYGDTDRTDIVLKLEDSRRYQGLVELEQLGLDLHRQAGFEIPRYWPVEINGIPALAVERFDRDSRCNPLFMESIFSLFASARQGHLANHYSVPYDDIGRAFDVPEVRLVDDVRAARVYLFKRLILAFLTGNGDLHMENLSIVQRDGVLAFSPVYDPAPMRAFKRHDELHPAEMTFGGYGSFDEKTKSMISFAQGIRRFARNLRLARPQWTKIIEDCLQATRDYPDRLGRLKRLPQEGRDRLIGIHRQISEKLQADL